MKQFTPSKRQSDILDRLSEDGFVSTDDLVVRYSVTPQTIRRDLNELDAQGLVTRFHGGAGQRRLGENQPYPDRKRSDVAAKRRIAEATAALVPNGASIFINIGTTTEAVADALIHHEGLKVVTNNINVAATLCRNPTFQVIITGGRVRNHDGGVMGLATADFISQFRVDIGIIGISGIDENGNLLDFDFEEVRTARAIVDNSQAVILVADRQKFGRHAMNRLGHVSELDKVVTDAPLSEPFQSVFTAANTPVIIAPATQD